MMLVKTHKDADGMRLFAICDPDLIGRRFEEGKRQLDINRSFYKGEEMDEDALRKLLTGTFTINACGKRSVELCILLGVVQRERVITIACVPHAEAMSEA